MCINPCRFLRGSAQHCQQTGGGSDSKSMPDSVREYQAYLGGEFLCVVVKGGGHISGVGCIETNYDCVF